MIAKDILGLIGNTPLVEIKRLNPNPNLKMYVKLEKYNPKVWALMSYHLTKKEKKF